MTPLEKAKKIVELSKKLNEETTQLSCHEEDFASSDQSREIRALLWTVLWTLYHTDGELREIVEDMDQAFREAVKVKEQKSED